MLSSCLIITTYNIQYSGVRLHSHDVKYGSGSGQQSVTAVENGDDVNSHWQILAGELYSFTAAVFASKDYLYYSVQTCSIFLMAFKQHSHVFVAFSNSAVKGNCKRGEPVKCNSKIRLKHLTTGCHLHSHLFAAPLTKEDQVIIIFSAHLISFYIQIFYERRHKMS